MNIIRNLPACAALCALLILPACVERTLILRSEPDGASIILNGESVGMTPTEVKFMTYGTFDIIAEAPRCSRLRATYAARPPWYERLPLDFFAENAWPFTIYDRHEVTLTLPPVPPLEASGVDRREQEMRVWTEEGTPPAPAEAKP